MPNLTEAEIEEEAVKWGLTDEEHGREHMRHYNQDFKQTGPAGAVAAP